MNTLWINNAVCNMSTVDTQGQVITQQVDTFDQQNNMIITTQQVSWIGENAGNSGKGKKQHLL